MRATVIFATSFAFVVCGIEAGAGEGERTIDVSRALDAAPPPSSPDDVAITSASADPPPLVAGMAWVFDLRWNRGDVWLVGAQKMTLPAPRPTPRVMGRFAIELFEGPILIERVRFDFPLLGAREFDTSTSFVKKLVTRVGVLFPVTSRGTHLELWDRATDRRWSIPWPPSTVAVAIDAGGPRAAPRDAAQGP